jgi:amicyanin
MKVGGVKAMKNRSVLFGVIGVAVVLVILGVILFEGKGNAPTTTGTSNDAGSMNMSSNNNSNQTPVATNKVSISNFTFSPASIKVKVGDTVTWTNHDSIGHTVTADSPSSDAPASDTLVKGKSYSFTFTKAGTYTYHCEPHPYMKGTVTVE